MDNRTKNTDLQNKIDAGKALAHEPEAEYIPLEPVEDSYTPETLETIAPEPDGDVETEGEDVKEEISSLPSIEDRYKESSQEAVALHFRNKKFTDAVLDASTLPDPTEQQLREYCLQSGSDYEELDDFTRNMVKTTLKNELRFGKIESVVESTRKVDKWVKEVQDFISNEKNISRYPSLENDEVAFKHFASNKASRVGMDLDDLVGLFMLKKSQETANNPKKTALLDRGNGRNTPPKKKGFDEADLQHLRVTDQKAYKKALKDNLVDIQL